MRWIIKMLVSIIPLTISDCAKITSQYDCNFIQNNYGQRVSWHQRLPVILYVHETFPEKYRHSLQEAVDKWNLVLQRKMLLITGTAFGNNAPKQDGVSVIYWLNDWEPNLSGQEARTIIYWDGDQIYEADIRINAKNYSYSVDAPDYKTIDFQSLMVHELGHVLGLKHDSMPGSVMAPNLNHGIERRNPTLVNLDSLKCAYAVQ